MHLLTWLPGEVYLLLLVTMLQMHLFCHVERNWCDVLCGWSLIVSLISSKNDMVIRTHNVIWPGKFVTNLNRPICFLYFYFMIFFLPWKLLQLPLRVRQVSSGVMMVSVLTAYTIAIEGTTVPMDPMKSTALPPRVGFMTSTGWRNALFIGLHQCGCVCFAHFLTKHSIVFLAGLFFCV